MCRQRVELGVNSGEEVMTIVKDKDMKIKSQELFDKGEFVASAIFCLADKVDNIATQFYYSRWTENSEDPSEVILQGLAQIASAISETKKGKF